MRVLGLSISTCCRKETYEEQAKDKEKAEASIEADPIIHAVGQVGRWQILVAVPLILSTWTIAAHHLVMIFQKADMDYTCGTPNVTDPCSDDCKKILYDRSTFKETIISEWDLVCAKKTLANATQTIAMLGVLLGNIVFGYLGDRYGRRVPSLVSSMLMLVFGVAAAFAPWLWLFIVLRFLVSFSSGGIMILAIVIIMEIIGPNWRELFSVIYHLPFNLGHLSLPLLAYLMRNWRHVQLTISLVSIFKISYFWITPESPKWLIMKGQKEKALKVLQKGARMNKRSEAGIEERIIAASKSGGTEEKKGNFWDVIHYPYMRLKAFCMFFSFFSCGLTFFGVADYVGTVSGNMFINVAISAAMCIPGTFIAIALCKYWGRKKTLFSAFAISAVSLILIACIPASIKQATLVCSILGIFGVSLSFPTVYLYGGELFPTVVRNSAIGIFTVSTRIASMVAPFIVQLKDNYYYLPPLIIGVFPLVAAGLCLLLPETRGKVLPDTMEESEQFGRRQKDLDKQ